LCSNGHFPQTFGAVVVIGFVIDIVGVSAGPNNGIEEHAVVALNENIETLTE
jgi:hypothetical protein